MGLLTDIVRGLFTPRPTVLDVARRELVPHFEAKGMRVHQLAERWPDGPVDLEMRDLVIRLQLDRGILEVTFGSRADPGAWFGMNEVQEHLGLAAGPDAEFPSVHESVVELRSLLQFHMPKVTGLFDRGSYAAAKRALEETRRTINNRIAPARGHRA